MPIVQVCPPAQARPHIPQLLLSLAVFVQVAAMPVPQVVCPSRRYDRLRRPFRRLRSSRDPSECLRRSSFRPQSTSSGFPYRPQSRVLRPRRLRLQRRCRRRGLDPLRDLLRPQLLGLVLLQDLLQPQLPGLVLFRDQPLLQLPVRPARDLPLVRQLPVRRPVQPLARQLPDHRPAVLPRAPRRALMSRVG